MTEKNRANFVAEWSAFLKLVVGVILGITISALALATEIGQQELALITGVLLAFLVAGFGIVVILAILAGQINLAYLVSEKTGEASLSRFQALIFTFVIAMSYFLFVLESLTPPTGTEYAGNGSLDAGSMITLPDIPGGVLVLLGISAGTYVVSKGIQGAQQGGKPKPDSGNAEDGRFVR